MRLIDADELERVAVTVDGRLVVYLTDIHNAPTVDLKDIYQEGYHDGHLDGYTKAINEARPQGEREFIEILAQNVPEDLCTYPEYKGKPYYSIHYKVNGEDFAGFGTYNPEVLSRYLRDYFMRGDKNEQTTN